MDFVAARDKAVSDHLKSSKIFKGISKTIQNELLDSIYEVYLDKVKSKIGQVNFVSVQADETMDVACKCQVVIVLRYTLKGQIKERFIMFTEAKVKTADALTHIKVDTLSDFHIKEKLIAQTYDGVATMKRSC